MRFRNIWILQKISGFPERFQDFMQGFHADFNEDFIQDSKISCKISVQISTKIYAGKKYSMNISARFHDSSADFDRLILNFRMM